MSYAIEVDSVTKIYRKGFRAVKVRAVNSLSFTIDAGTVWGFAGPNGAGKTTTLKMIMGLVRPGSGRIVLDGRPVSSPESRGRVAFLSEQPYFYDHLTVGETAAFAHRLRRLPRPELHRQVGAALDRVGLSDARRLKIKELSKGMQQRLNMACALLGDPRIFILDEPMSGMDPPGRRLFREIIRGLGEQGRTVLFSTHILEDIESLCSGVIALSRGSLRYRGDIGALLERGYTGTEIITTPPDDRLAAELRSRGVRVTGIDAGRCRLFVPARGDPAACQRLLWEHGMTAESIVRRTRSLEELLYGREEEEAAS